MNYFDSQYFTYSEEKLFCENVDLNEIAEQLGTPTYVYSKKFMQNSFSEFSDAFSKLDHKIFFACKSNYNINIIRLFNDLGAGIDVNSAGEYYRAKKAGVAPKNMILSGVGKTKDEIKLALENELRLIKVESIGEIEVINEVAKDLGKKAPIAIRVNPNVDPSTHPYISTGLAENKFGVDETAAMETFTHASKLSNIQLLGIDMHIGSQITKKEPYVEAISKLVDIVKKLKKQDIILSHIDVGGGMGIKYIDEKPFSLKEFANAIIPILKESECEIFFEPGRLLTANGGCLLTEVLYVKNNLSKNFVVVDAAMNDLLRPSIYKAYHHIQPVNKIFKEDIIADIVGPICESGDFLAKQREICKSNPKDLLAVMSAGAYGMVMSSNYNARRRPAEILVDNDKFSVIRKRETYEQLMENEAIV